MPLVSVIVPVYNVAEYLSKCLDSLINQTLEDIEIILIDDGSDDNSGNLCDLYADKDNRIRVIHKANEGLAQARNDGVDASTSPYVMFVDSDDWVNNNFCELPYLVAVENNADLVLFLYNKVIDGKIIRKNANVKTGLMTEAEAIHFNLNYAPAAWLGLYKKSIFNNIRFPNGKLFEDVGTSHKLIHASNKVYFLNEFIYFYRMERPGSIMTNCYTLENPDYKEMRIRKIVDLYRWGYKDYIQDEAISLIVKYGHHEKIMNGIYQIVSEISREIPDNLCIKRKVLLMIFRVSPDLFDAACICFGRRLKSGKLHSI